MCWKGEVVDISERSFRNRSSKQYLKATKKTEMGQSEVAPLAGAKTFRSDHLAQLSLFPSQLTALTISISAQSVS
ncbi:hypothetical protein N7541_010036 [Penicillium brevicompactum]|uniref:Uncharacterized protein n=1 Tax=Penicillium brevicompactum TaxID=5074 RepID=A0A9W9UH85_PENBR|nr:hypothetical protein N7541_010036 [Penicillium brevicompactum]